MYITPFKLNYTDLSSCSKRPPGGVYLVPPDAASPRSTLQEKQRQDERRCEWFVDRKDDLNATNAKELISRVIAKLGLGLRDQDGETLFYFLSEFFLNYQQQKVGIHRNYFT